MTNPALETDYQNIVTRERVLIKLPKEQVIETIRGLVFDGSNDYLITRELIHILPAGQFTCLVIRPEVLQDPWTGAECQAQINQVLQHFKQLGLIGRELAPIDKKQTTANKGGRPAALDYDQAYQEIYQGGQDYRTVFLSWYADLEDKHCTFAEYKDRFRKAMKRRNIKKDISLVSAVSADYPDL